MGPLTLIVDDQATVVHCGGSVEEIFGCTAASASGAPVSRFFVDSLPKPEESEDLVLGIRRSDGVPFPVWARVDRWASASGTYFIVTVDPDPRDRMTAYHRLYADATAFVARAATLTDAAAAMMPVVAAAVGWDAATVWIPGESGNLSCRLFWSADDHLELRDLTLKTELASGQDLPGQVRATGAVQWTEDLDERSERTMAARRADMRSVLAFPILVGGEIGGVVELFSRTLISPDAGLLRLVRHIGIELGFLLQRENAFLALRSSEARYRQLAMTSEDAQLFAHVGSFSLDVATERVQWSDEMYRLFGLVPGSRAIDREYARSFVIEQDRAAVRDAFEASLHGQPLDLKFSIVTEGGEQRMLRMRGKLVDVDGEEARVLGSALDITADEKAVREHLDMQHELEDAKRMTSLGRLAATMAHEFNNILAGIGGFAEFLARHAHNEENREASSQIRNAIRRGKGVTADILRYAHAGKPMLTTLEVRSWLEAFMPEANALTEGRVVLEAPDMLHVRADVGQLNQALANLVINARDASTAGERIIIRAGITERDGQPTLDLAVIDRGCGIAPEIRDRIFEPLFTTKRTGTGLGLPLVDQIVRAHGGTIRLRSEPGNGSEFHILIPIADPPPVPTRQRASMSIVLADDNETFAGVVSQVLETHGLRVRVVFRAAEVIPTLAREMADALILDVGLPDMTGPDVYAAIIDRWPALPVVFVSGRQASNIEPLVRQRHVAFLQKPFVIDDLLAALKRVVAAGVFALSLLSPCVSYGSL